MIFGSRSTELLLEIGQCAISSVHLFDFKFSKALDCLSVFHDGDMVEHDVCDRDMVYAYPHTGPPDS
jgi:hypothetical protein